MDRPVGCRVLTRDHDSGGRQGRMGRRARPRGVAEQACVHVTHRCHGREFLLRFEVDRRRYRERLRQMAVGYPVSVLDYVITSNHVHLLLWAAKMEYISEGLRFLQGHGSAGLQPAQAPGRRVLERALPRHADSERRAPVAVLVLH